MEMLAGMQNTVASSGTSAYGKKLMEKMGWSEWVVEWSGSGKGWNRNQEEHRCQEEG